MVTTSRIERRYEMRVRLLPVVLLGLAACGSGSSDSATPTTSSTPSTAAPTPTTPVTSPTSTDQPTPPSSVPASTAASTTEPTLASPPWDFTFGDVDGLVAVDAPHASDYPLDDEVTAVWATSKGITDGYMTLRDVKGGPATSPEGDVTATRIEAPAGEAWLVIDNVPDDPPPTSATRIMWWRDDGRVWIVSNFGLSPENLTTLALQIEAGPNGSYTLPDASMTLVGSASLASYQSMTQSWTLDGHNLSLTVANGGLAQQVSDLPVRDLAKYTVAGHAGYALPSPMDRST